MEQTQKTQDIVDIIEVKNDIIFLKDKTLCQILTVGGINFDLKSEAEKEQILGSFQSFINTLDFPIQFFIHSRKTNITNYLKKIDDRKTKETNELLKIQIEEYASFIRSFIEENPIITKTFFIIVRYIPLLVAIEAGGILKLFKALSSQKEDVKKAEEESLEESARQLKFRTEQVMDGLASIGLKPIILNSEEAMELYYNLYNPELTDKQNLAIAKAATDKPDTSKEKNE